MGARRIPPAPLPPCPHAGTHGERWLMKARVLTIAGSDSGGGAGVQADLKVIAALGGFGMSAITALTAQNTRGVEGIFEVTPEFVGEQIDAVLSDLGADAVKTGMLAGVGIVRTVARKLREHGTENVVVDPVMVAKGGDRLLAADAVDALVSEVLPLARVVTPNLPEVQALTGSEISTLKEMKAAGVGA